jgi:serine/threonine-protein kinase
LIDDRYRLKRVLGEGGFARVFEARDIQLERQVVLKLLKRECIDEVQAERLFREGKAAASLDHPGIVRVYNFGNDLELTRTYLTFEYLPGETLDARLVTGAGKALSLGFTIRLGIEISDALTVVHDAGIIHRDIKPSNILLAKRRDKEQVKLLDFGIAKVRNTAALTATGEICGSLQYMAPEQYYDTSGVDARCDLYALGAVLFECATGHKVRRAQSLWALIEEIVDGPEVNVQAAGVPSALATVIARCLHKDPDARYADAVQLREALEQIEPLADSTS